MELDNTQKKFIAEVDQKVKWLKSLGYADNSVLAHCQTFLPSLKSVLFNAPEKELDLYLYALEGFRYLAAKLTKYN